MSIIKINIRTSITNNTDSEQEVGGNISTVKEFQTPDNFEKDDYWLILRKRFSRSRF